LLRFLLGYRGRRAFRDYREFLVHRGRREYRAFQGCLGFLELQVHRA
jgi:hypothetical protein